MDVVKIGFCESDYKVLVKNFMLLLEKSINNLLSHVNS